MRTTRVNRRPIKRQGGFAMVAVLMVMALMLGMNAALHGGILSDTQLRGAHASAITAFYAAEAGINRGMAENVNVFRAYNQPQDFSLHTFPLGNRTVSYQLQVVPGYATGKPITVPAGQQFEGLNSIHYRYTARGSSERTLGDTEVTLGTEFDVNYIPLFQFLAFYQNDLEILPGPTMTLHGPIHTNGSLYLNTNNTLTIADNPPVTQTVRITAAGDVWRGRKNDSSCTGTAVLISKLTTTANHLTPLPLQDLTCSGGNRVKKTDAQLSTWLGSIKQHVQTIGVPAPSVVNRGTGDFWLNADLRIVLNLTNLSAGYAAIEVQGPGGAVDPILNPRLQAFMVAQPGRISYNDVPTVQASYTLATAYTPNFVTPAGAPGNTLVYPCPQTNLLALCSNATANYWATCTPAGGAVATCPAYQGNVNVPTPPTFTTARRGGFYNNREHRWVYMLNVNLHDLLQWNRAQPIGNRLFDPDDTTDGGLVFFLSVQGPLSTSGPVGVNDPSYGVRVFGTPNFDFPVPGADPTGATMASDQAAYVEGDYNVDVGHGLYDAAHPKMPAAIMADAINVLSQNWSGATNGGCRNDCQSRVTLTSRPTRSTWINAAFLGGVDTTVGGTVAVPGVYNGGLENYPRFHENWSGSTLTYRGSFVTLGNSLRSFGLWCGTGGSAASGCNIYNAPSTRAWDFDTSFQSVAWLPPLTPRVLSVQQVLFTENFR